MKFLERTLLLFSLLMIFVAQVRAEGKPEITYIDCSWDSKTNKVKTEYKTITDYVVFQNSSTLTLDNNHKYWVAPKGQTTVSDCITIIGDDVHIILSEGAELICEGGILVKGNNKLHIHATTLTAVSTVGKLKVSNKYKNYAGIGSGKDENSGDIFIHGGEISATGGDGAAAIGAGAAEEMHPVGHVTIYDGRVYATGGNEAAGIGSGTYRGYTKGKSGYAQVTIYGGDIFAFGGNKAAGIGTGYGGLDNGSIHIYGGEIVAEGGDFGSGIGGGHLSGGGTVWIHYNDADYYHVTAKGGKKGAGIGSGAQESDRPLSGEVVIEGAKVEATGGSYGAGIGLGYQHGEDCSMRIDITGGTIHAYGGTDAAGIGIGENQGMFVSNNQTVVHIGGAAQVTAEGSSYGAGIGGGEDFKGAKVTIDGQATVVAIAGSDCDATKKKGGSAIGSGDISSFSSVDSKESVAGDLTIASELMVTAGADKYNVDQFTESDRVYACRWRNYARVEPCRHADFTYTIDEDTHHTKHCRYCKYTLQEVHSYTTGGVCVCGRKESDENTYFAVTLNTATALNTTNYGLSTIRNYASGRTLILPVPEEVEGLSFVGWQEQKPTTGSYPYLLKDNETVEYEAGDEITVNKDVNLYARYIYKAKSTVWNWSDDYSSATLTINIAGTTTKWTNGSNGVTITIDHTSQNATESVNGYVRHTATATRKLEGHTYTFTTEVMTPCIYKVDIANEQDNTEVLHNASGAIVNTVTLTGRTLHQNESWNTICLPFSLTAEQIAESVLKDADICTLTETQFENGTLSLNFTQVSTIEAGKPYLVKWESGSDVVNPAFHDVSIDDDVPEVFNTQYVSFLGCFSPVKLSANDRSVLYLGADNTLYYPSANMNVNSCRAYFLLNGLNAGDMPNAVTDFKLNFNDDAAGIISASQGKSVGVPGRGWYTLDGRQLSGRPHSRGVYVNNGKKVVVK